MAAFNSGAKHQIRNETIFTDLGLNFIPHPVTKNVPVLKNEVAIKRAVRNLILTNYYERPYNPGFGGNITAYLFENFTPITKASIERAIQDAFEQYEPRADLIDVTVVPNPDLNGLVVNITFSPLNTREVDQLSFTVERIR